MPQLRILFLTKNLILLAQHNDFRLMRSGLLRIEQSEAHDRQSIPRFPLMCNRPIELDRANATQSVNDVGFELFAIGHVPDKNSLIFLEFNQLGQISGNTEAAFVVDIRRSHYSSMNFRFEERDLHGPETSLEFIGTQELAYSSMTRQRARPLESQDSSLLEFLSSRVLGFHLVQTLSFV